MRIFAVVAFAAILACASSLAAQTTAAEPDMMPWGILLDWRPDQGTVRYEAEDVQISIAPSDAANPEDRVAILTVRSPGQTPVTLRGAPGTLWRFGIGRVDMRVKTPAVLLETFTGGAHCCSVIDVAVPTGAAYRVVRLTRRDRDGTVRKMFDAELDRFPIDLSGDGIADFVLTDDAFLYRFSSYAGSVAPPIVLNIVNGRAVDVSGTPGLRPLFAYEMSKARSYCIGPKWHTDERNGACAGYVANAARIGQFDAAWKRMMARYDRSSTWNDKAFPSDLRDFLRQHGYIR